MKKLMVLVAALALVAASAMTAAAADWNFYGSARITSIIYDVDGPGVDTTSWTHSLINGSRVGANVQVSDELSGRFEFGTGQFGGAEQVRTRLIYGVWNFGAGSFLVGQTYGPFNMFYSNQHAATGGSAAVNYQPTITRHNADGGLLPYGGVYTGRTPQLQLSFGDFSIAAVQPNQRVLAGAASSEAKMPQIQASYSMKFDNISVALAGAYNNYDIVMAAGNEFDVNSYAVALGAKATFGPASLGGNVYFGMNVDGIGMWSGFDNDPAINAAGNDTIDNDAYGFILVGTYTFNDMLGIEAGYGYTEGERDNAVSEDSVSSYYLQAPITVAPGVFIAPEIGYIDHEKDMAGNTENEITYYGAKFQINF